MLHSFERTDFEGDLFDMWILEAHSACNGLSSLNFHAFQFCVGLSWLVLAIDYHFLKPLVVATF